MDFKLVLEKLLAAFENDKIRYALIGGLALGTWGVTRGTVDADFLVHHDDMGKVDTIMTGLGYGCTYHSDNVSQYTSPSEIFGEVDFLHAFRMHSLSMLERTEVKKIFNGTLTIKVAKIEDLIGFKIQAIANNKSRKAMDLSDIEALITANKAVIHWDLIREYCDLFGFKELFDTLRDKYGDD